MLVGALPFAAGDPMEWLHCHIAKLAVAPSARRSEIPEPLSAIILKLLAKAPEERYQTAAGVEADLRRCLSALEARERIESFTLGAADVPDRLLVSEKLYGREKEIELLLASFGRVAGRRRPELVLVSGYSGVGNPPWSMNSISRSSRRGAFLRPASSTSTSGTSLMRPSRKPSRASSVPSWRRTKKSWAVGAMPSARRSIRMVSSWWISSRS